MILYIWGDITHGNIIFQPGGAKIGTFDPYPSHSADPYKIKMVRSVNVVNKSGKTFMPSQGPKSRPMNSIINQNVMKYVYLYCCLQKILKMYNVFKTFVKSFIVLYSISLTENKRKTVRYIKYLLE